MQTDVDHLVIAARTLDDGVRWCEAVLGITPQPGGRHALMGTHNRLFSIAGDAYPRAYAEVIAIDPQAPAPGRARWFALDEALPAEPGLVHVVTRTPNLDMHRWGLVASGLEPGDTLAAERETPSGLLRWRIVVPADGGLPCGGALPTLIEWAGPRHPSDALPPSGVRLRSLRLRGVPPAARDVLRLRGAAYDDRPGPALEAVLATPKGDVRLASAVPAN